jgi:aminotransferase
MGNSSLISARTRETRISAIKEMSIRSAQVPDAVSLAWGLPSFRTPEPIRNAATQALVQDRRAGMYTLPAGLPELRSAAAADYQRFTGLSTTTPESRITITAGNMEGLDTLLHVLLDPGDEVIVTDPGFVSHITQIRFNGGVPVYWRLEEAKGWEPDPGILPQLVTERTKAILLVSPSNPTGKVLSEAAFRAVAEQAIAHGLLIICDDPYSHFIYESPRQFFDLASLPELKEHLAYLFTFSKAYAMSGWRVGYMVMPETLHAAVVKIHDMTMICTPRISQIAALAALEGAQNHISEFRKILSRRRELICERLDRLNSVFSYVRPDGAYYVFPRLLERADDVAFAYLMLDQAKVAVTPGSAFGPSGVNHFRMAYCVDDDTLNLTFDRLDVFFGV